MVETSQDVGKEEELSELRTELEEPQQRPQQQRQEERPPQPQPEADHRELSQPEELVGEVEREVAAPPPDAQAEVTTSGMLLPLRGPTPTMIDLTSDDPPSDKGKQKANVKMVDASDRPRTSTTPDGDATEASAGWPDFVELELMRAKEELRAGVGRPSSSGMRPIPTLSPSSPLMIRTKCNTRSTSRGSASTPCNPCGWSWIPWSDTCQGPSR
jgi:hypothetical protein